MLQSLQIENFTIIQSLELDFQGGMTVITGETGAGKSIILDALQLALGHRADAHCVGQYANQCQVTATFAIHNIPLAKAWLAAQQLTTEDECILRRVISSDGRSKAYINGQIMPLQPLRELSHLLIAIHGQHQHQLLAKPEIQRELLDKFAAHPELLTKVAQAAADIRATEQQLAQVSTHLPEHAAKVQLLEFQVQELNELALSAEEFQELDAQHQQLAHSEQLLKGTQQALNYLQAEEPAVLSLLNHTHHELSTLEHLIPNFNSALELINNALINAQEAYDEVHRIQQSIAIDPEKLQSIETRLSKIYSIARKHKVKAERLPELHQDLLKQLDQIVHADEHCTRLQKQLTAQQKIYEEHALKLNQSRQKAAQNLAYQIRAKIRGLAMPKGEFAIQLTPNSVPYSNHGVDHITFEVSANPGQPLQALNKVASGGELSRISLALQVVTAHHNITPTLIFDEVDVGIGGGTAEIVGQLLQQLTQTYQVFCITHLPQVAAQGHQHLKVEKILHEQHTQTTIKPLNKEEKIQEIARMLGGVKITAQTLAHAREMTREA